ncbi:MAG: 50S ribosomal protein L9 [Bacteroidales bacterium]|jgi:large subunit ribosomal protein L9|nr:50S ribosomal protein L9 [Bacteroidales bacterium]
MEVILTQDVVKLGYKNDIVTVKNGFANNFLIPKGMAVMATGSLKKVLAENIKQQSFKEEKTRKDAEAIAVKIEGITVKIAAKAGTSGKIFGSVNSIQVAEALKNQHGVEIDRKSIVIKGDSIKDLGIYKAGVTLYRDIKAEISLDVYAEE